MTLAEIEDAILERSSLGRPLGPTLTAHVVRTLRRARGADEQSGQVVERPPGLPSRFGPSTYDFDPETAHEAHNLYEAVMLAAAWANGVRRAPPEECRAEVQKWSALAVAFGAVKS